MEKSLSNVDNKNYYYGTNFDSTILPRGLLGVQVYDFF